MNLKIEDFKTFIVHDGYRSFVFRWQSAEARGSIQHHWPYLHDQPLFVARGIRAWREPGALLVV